MNLSPSPHLLVVDDEPELRALLQEYFTGHGYQVSVAGDAKAAREIMGRTPAQLAILDVNMPGEDGLSLARWLRGQHARTGIIMLTTAAETIDRVVGLEIGTDDYVPKPFDLRELLARVRAVWRRLSVAGDAGSASVEASAGASAKSAAASASAASSPVDASQRVRFGRCLLDLDERLLDDPSQAVENVHVVAGADLLGRGQ